MNRYHTIRMILLLLSVSVLSGASVLFFVHELYFCLLFSLLGLLALIVFGCFSQRHATNLILRMVESVRYNDFSLNFDVGEKDTVERKLRMEINAVVADFRKQLSEHQERYQYYETLLDTADCCLLVTDKKQRIHWMNRTAVNDLCGHSIHSLEELNGLNKEFSQMLAQLMPGEVKVIRLYREDFIQEMAVTVTEYITSGNSYRLVHLKNIRSVLEENEMEAWQKLIRVLTHEIMNSIAPIISLSETLVDRVMMDEEDGQDSMVLQGMKAIHRRSKGLLEFVENYRKLSRISSPNPIPITIGELLGDIKKLMPGKEVPIHYQIEDPQQVLMIDRAQIEQVLINLLKNAVEACAEQAQPEVSVTTSYLAEKHIFQLTVKDNGCGILPEVQDKIFVPFFTTKAKGSGIGLSLCKQIMNLHGGSITMKSESGKGTSFMLKFLCRER